MPQLIRPRLQLPLAFALALFACDTQKPAGSTPSATAVATANPSTRASSATTSAPSAPTALATAPASASPYPGRSALPTPAEWKAVKEVTVKGSSALGCETKMVREWLRVTCRGKNNTGGSPTGILVIKGEKPGTHAFSRAGITSLITPYVSDTRTEVSFGWTDHSYVLVLDWPKGAPMPPIVGEFGGAASPLDNAHFKVGKKPHDDFMCKCVLNGFDGTIPKPKDGATCQEEYMPGEYDEDCARTYDGNCKKLFQCIAQSADAPPKCRPGYENLFPMWCIKTCDTKKDCAGTLPCTDIGRPKKFCFRNGG